MAFFESGMPAVTKRHMIKALREKEGAEEPAKRRTILHDAIPSCCLEGLVATSPMGLFHRLGRPINTQFMEHAYVGCKHNRERPALKTSLPIIVRRKTIVIIFT